MPSSSRDFIRKVARGTSWPFRTVIGAGRRLRLRINRRTRDEHQQLRGAETPGSPHCPGALDANGNSAGTTTQVVAENQGSGPGASGNNPIPRARVTGYGTNQPAVVGPASGHKPWHDQQSGLL